MVKQRMSSVDVAGEVACLKQRLLGLRVANVYDLNAKASAHRRPALASWLLLRAQRR
jgi:predicted ribosome quality control (RQC) complex YloA/Tae2 family protein